MNVTEAEVRARLLVQERLVGRCCVDELLVEGPRPLEEFPPQFL